MIEALRKSQGIQGIIADKLISKSTWNNWVKTLCKELGIEPDRRFPMKCEFRIMVGVGAGLKIQSGLKDDDGYHMYGGGYTLEIGAEVDASYFVGYHESMKRVKFAGNCFNLQFTIIIDDENAAKQYAKMKY